MNPAQDKIPEQLLEILNSDDFEDDGNIHISSVGIDGNNEIVEFLVDTGNSQSPKQKWRLEISSVQSENIVLGWDPDFKLYDDHFMLSPFTDEIVSLYFNGEKGNGEKLLFDLYSAHKKNFKNFFDLEKFINRNADLATLFNYGDAWFASGPKKILNVYFECLNANNKKPYYLNGTNKHYNANLKFLILGKSHFIAEDFNFIFTGNLP
jgi:hypothetical protein